jgi:two-component system, chemotaxis family, chemotaxis protein CheY
MKTKSPIIALVDDDKIFQLTSARMIQALQLSQDVLQFENGEEALQYLRENADLPENLPDYIFLDINMPYVDGWMFLADYSTLKAAFRKEIQIFMISSSIDSRDIIRAQKNSDVRDYVIKPVTPEKFREMVGFRV